ncbi:2-amino-4-hydroxy-6-hydroxymethyldihydropteridine diphosphokinase [Halomonas alkaliantarctica]|nr:2-amino-4-hydroxy-6-hydroxymethyldihydropteridine diphosphokinase [Halomonas alkaliantarctica]
MPKASSTATQTPHECVISVGSNIDPEHHYTQVIEILSQECELIAHTTPIRTTPVGYQAQPDFLNSAVLVRTALPQADFKEYLKRVEDRLGRERGPIKSGPRTMDLDIIAWDGELVDEGYHRHDYVRGPVDELLKESGRTLNGG